jgi:hypothetical protein
MEFRNSEGPTGVSISGAIVDHCIRAAKDGPMRGAKLPEAPSVLFDLLPLPRLN